MGICSSTCDECADPLPYTKAKPLGKEDIEALETEAKKDEKLTCLPSRMCINGSNGVASMYSQQGKKGTNQDCMVVWEDFGSCEDTVFCGVFDGHGPYGHLVARRVRDSLPSTLMDQWQELIAAESTSSSEGNQSKDSDELIENNVKADSDPGKNESPVFDFEVWKESCLRAFKLMDKKLKLHPTLDCFWSGTTAVTVVKQDQDLVIANVGDSRAILGTMSDDNNLMAIQLTVDLKPNLPQEAERIRQCKGRVFSLEDEPDVYRVWLPNDDSPGLAMARAFGDFCLKDFGVVSVPEISRRRLTSRDQFIVLASDGVWDVLTNQEVVRIVSSAPTRGVAAKVVVESAVRAWRRKYPTSKADDCAAVCLYVDSQSATSRHGKENSECLSTKNVSAKQEGMLRGEKSDTSENNVVINNTSDQEKTENLLKEERPDGQESTRSLAEYIATDEWTALDGLSRVNSLISLPRFMTRDKKYEESKRKRCFH